MGDFKASYLSGIAVSVTLAVVAAIYKMLGNLTTFQTLWFFGLGLPGAFLLTFWGLNQFRAWAGIAPPLSRKKPSQDVIDHLARLRSDAIHMLNRRVRSVGEVEQFVVNQESWRQEVLKILRASCTEAVVLSFDRLGSVPVRRFGHTFDSRHGHQLEMLALRIEIIQKIVDRYTA